MVKEHRLDNKDLRQKSQKATKTTCEKDAKEKEIDQELEMVKDGIEDLQEKSQQVQ